MMLSHPTVASALQADAFPLDATQAHFSNGHRLAILETCNQHLPNTTIFCAIKIVSHMMCELNVEYSDGKHGDAMRIALHTSSQRDYESRDDNRFRENARNEAQAAEPLAPDIVSQILARNDISKHHRGILPTNNTFAAKRGAGFARSFSYTTLAPARAILLTRTQIRAARGTFDEFEIAMRDSDGKVHFSNVASCMRNWNTNDFDLYDSYRKRLKTDYLYFTRDQ